MRVAVVMPMSPESAVADVMIQAIPDLRIRWEIDVWCPSEAKHRPCPAPIKPFASATNDVLNALAEYELVVYILDDSPLCASILNLARVIPGLVVLHDASLTTMIRSAAVETGTLDELVARVTAVSGADQAEILRDPDRTGGPEGWLRFCAEVPLTDVAIEGSLGVVVHSMWHAQQVDGLTLGDVTVAPVPVPVPVPSARLGFDVGETDEPSRLLADLPDDAVLVVSIETVNAGRQIDVLLRAMADADVLGRRVHLLAAGPFDDQTSTDLLRLAQSLGLEDRFAVTGNADLSSLRKFVARADILAVLRDPVLDGQSASLLTQLLSGKPVIVYDHAHYSELPDDVAVKVDPLDATAGVRQALRLLVDDEGERERRGECARDYVVRSRSGTAYAAALFEAGELALAAKPRLYLGTDLGERLRRLGLDREEAVVDAVTALAFDLFDLA
jgi:glycosyltransferase involved in cell wall biosynthesis